jgi:hypothetical protein
MKYFFILSLVFLSCSRNIQSQKCLTYNTKRNLEISCCVDSVYTCLPDSLFPNWGKALTKCFTFNSDTILIAFYFKDNQEYSKEIAESLLKNDTITEYGAIRKKASICTKSIVGEYFIQNSNKKFRNYLLIGE